MKYHIMAFGIPKIPHKIGKVTWTNHAIKRSRSRNLKLPKYVDTRIHTVVEYDSKTKIRLIMMPHAIIALNDDMEIVTILFPRMRFSISKDKYNKPQQPKLIRMKYD